ncbi:hypothetical protein CL622_04610, partial [archaeon]|nr:hypothetical protein [archaeon]
MLSDIITKKVSVRIIRILIEKKASLSEIARETDTTKANVFNSIHELEKIDIARKEIKGRTHIYRFNYLHPQAKEVLFRFIKKKQEEYITKMKGIPVLVHHTLSHMLGKKYEGVLFFGSSIDGNYQDIDAFVLAKDIQERKIQEQLKIIHPKLSMTLGTLKELRHGFEEEDMLYTNIILGIPFGCEHSILEIRHKKFLTRRIDIVERFIIGYRE